MINLAQILIASGLSALISGIVALGIAWYFRFHTKPTHEKIFDNNRDSNVARIFTQISFFDGYVDYVFTTLTKDFGYLSRDRRRVVPEVFELLSVNDENPFPERNYVEISELQEKFKSIKPNLDTRLKNMRKIRKLFLEDYHIYQNYFHDSFLREVDSYYSGADLYVELTLENELISSCLIERMDSAKAIVNYVKSDKLITNQGMVKDFVDRWERTMKLFPELLEE